MKEQTKEISTAGEVVRIATNKDKKIHYGIFEQVDGKFVYFEQDNQYKDARSHVIKQIGETWVPLPIYFFPNLDDPLAYGSIEELFQEIRNFLIEYVDIVEHECYDVISSFIIGSWRAEDFHTAPYLLPIGDVGVGKTRLLEVLGELCYRAIVSPSISPAAVVRLLANFRATMLVDETEILNVETKQELVAILNAGYKRGQYYIRAEQDGSGVELWNTFGFKALAGTQDFARALSSRCIPIPMERATRPIRKSIDKDKGLELRTKLLDYRFKTLHTPLPEVDLPFKNGRAHELFSPLVQIAPESYRKSIIDYGLKLEQQAQVEDSTGFEADIIKCILALKGDRVKAADILQFMINNGDIDQPDPKKEQSLKNRISRTIKNKFHFQKVARDKSFVIDSDKLERLKHRYLYPEKTAQTAQTAQPNTNECADCADCADLQDTLLGAEMDANQGCDEVRSAK